MHDESASLDKRGILIAVLLFAMIFLNYLDRQILSILAPVLHREIGLDPEHYAWAVDAFLLAYAVMYVGSGVLLDYVRSRWGLSFVVGLWSLVCCLHSTVRGFVGMMVFRFLLGLAEPGAWTGAVKTVSECYTAKHRGIITGVFTAGSGVGALVAPPLVVWLTLHCGWRSSFLLPGTAGLLWVLLWLWVTRKAIRPVTSGFDKVNPGLRGWRSAIHDRRLVSFVGCRFFGDSSGYFFLFWLPEYLMSSKGFSFVRMGLLGWIPFCFLDLGSVIGGYTSGRLIGTGVPPILTRKILMTMAACLGIAGIASQNRLGPLTALLALCISSFGVGVWSANLHALAADGFPEQNVASNHGIAGSAGAIGGVIFNTSVGHFVSTGNHLPIFISLASLEPLGVMFLWMLFKEKQRPID